MSQRRAIAEIERFLSTSEPEVLSVSGRWGVGKTHSWDETLKARRGSTPLRRYAYVSVFGLRSLDALKTAIVQSTVLLDGEELEPTVESFRKHVASAAGLRKLAEETARRGLGAVSRGASAIPVAGKLADLITPGATLLIRSQIVCIDDIERAGQGLDVADVLGLVSSLRERRRCKVVLLLNEDGLGEQGSKYRAYLEKVVDQAVRFEPTPRESATAAIGAQDGLGTRLAEQTVKLGIGNIRVIRRIRRFLGYIEPTLAGLHDGVTEQVVHSIALLGWCVFEPTLAPGLDHVRHYARFSGLFSKEKRSTEELRVGQQLQAYGFSSFDAIDALILAGLEAGAFDTAALRAALEEVSRKLARQDVREAIGKPWSIYRSGLGDDTAGFLDALTGAIEEHGGEMTPQDASDSLGFMRELGRPEEADRLLRVYLDAQRDKGREFFAVGADARGRLDPAIAAAFDERLARMPLSKDPVEVLLRIAGTRSWNPEDVAYLATVPVDGYLDIIKGLGGRELHTAISMALDFGRMDPRQSDYGEVARRMASALRRAAAENDLNRLRLKDHLDALPPEMVSDDPSVGSRSAGTDAQVSHPN